MVPQTRAPDVLVYPLKVPTQDASVTAVRESETLVITNRGTQEMRGVVVWLNREWACWVARVPVGVPVRVGLDRFVNRHDERFPLPTWLAPEKTVGIVLVELYEGPVDGGDHGGRRWRAEVREQSV